MIQKYDKRNNDIKVFINDKLYDRLDAKVSVFDSLVQGGDGVWEGREISSLRPQRRNLWPYPSSSTSMVIH